MSGTAEEIEQFLELQKPAMLYFSKSLVDPDSIDPEQFKTLKEFKEKMRLQGLTESYDSIIDFKHKFSKQLAINIGNIITSALQSDTYTTSTNELKKDINSDKIEKIENQSSIIESTIISPVTVKKEKLTQQKIDEFLIKSVVSSANPSGWAKIAAVGLYLQTYTPINYKELEFQKLQAFLKSRKLFEFKTENTHPILRLSLPLADK